MESQLQNNPQQFNPVTTPNQPSQAVAIPAPNPAAVTSTGISAKLGAIIIAAIIIIAVGIYFAFFAKPPPSSIKGISGQMQNLPANSVQNGSNQAASPGNISFKCSDVLTLADIQTVAGISGLSETDGNDLSPTELSCGYNSIGSQNAFNLVLTIDSDSASNLEQGFNVLKTAASGTPVTGVGSAALQGSLTGYPVVYVISSNGKYSITLQGAQHFNGIMSKDPNLVSNADAIYISLAKFIDSELSQKNFGNGQTGNQTSGNSMAANSGQSSGLTCDNLITLDQVKSAFNDNSMTEQPSDNSGPSLGCLYTNSTAEQKAELLGTLEISIEPATHVDVQAELSQWKTTYQGGVFPGLGSSAAEGEQKFGVISSNKKYFFTVAGSFDNLLNPLSVTAQQALDTRIGLSVAKTIDASLNNY